MKPHKDHRIAPMPKGIYSRPPTLDQSGLRVTVYGEDGSGYGDFDFEDVDAPQKLVKNLVCAFSKATSPEGRWRSKATVNTAASMLRSFAVQISTQNPDLEQISDLSPEMWWAWRSSVEKRSRWPGQINLVRALLFEVDDLPDTTRKALKQRAKKPKSRTYSAYSIAEFRRIQAAAWRVVRRARHRIRSNVSYLEMYRQGLEPADALSFPIRKQQWTRGMLLDYFSKTGEFPPPGVPPHYYGNDFRNMLGVTYTGHISQALFATTLEAFSLMI